MYSTQLVQILKVLRVEEVKQLSIYLKNQASVSPVVMRLFHYLKKYAPTYDSPKLMREKVSKYVFKNVDHSVKQLNKVVYELKQQVENFLVHQALQKDAIQKEKILLSTLKSRNYSGYSKRNQKLMSMFQQSFDMDSPLVFHHDSFQLNYALWSSVTTEKLGTKYVHLQIANADFDKYYYLLKLKIILEHLLVLQLRPNIKALPNQAATLALIKAHPTFSAAILPNLLLQAIQLVQTGTLNQYLQLKTNLFSKIKEIPKKEARDLIVVLINFFIQNVNKLTKLATLDGFELYAFADQHQLLIENKQIRDIEYVNAASIAINNLQFEWATDFINRYKLYLPYKIQETTSTYLNAFWYFKKKEFDTVIKLLNPIEKDKNATIPIAIKTRTLKIRALFEAETSIEELSAKELNAIKSQIGSFSRFIYKHPQLGLSKKGEYVAFCDFLQKLLKITGPLNKQLLKLDKLQHQIEQTNKVALKPWLIDKIYRMKKHLSPTSKR